MNCSIDGCEDRIHARGWCEKHYKRWQRNGNPNTIKQEHENHGYSDHLLYRVWDGMKDRCYNSNNTRYSDWGGRGVIVCEEWRNSAKVFIEWALPLWKGGLQIDRRDNDGNYTPENCRFITPKMNCDNRKLLQSNNTSGYRGVSWDKQHKKWIAYIYINNKQIYLGCFNSPKLAALVYDKAVPDNRPRNFKWEI